MDDNRLTKNKTEKKIKGSYLHPLPLDPTHRNCPLHLL